LIEIDQVGVVDLALNFIAARKNGWRVTRIRRSYLSGNSLSSSADELQDRLEPSKVSC